jgi:hypothetical protein
MHSDLFSLHLHSSSRPVSCLSFPTHLYPYIAYFNFTFETSVSCIFKTCSYHVFLSFLCFLVQITDILSCAAPNLLKSDFWNLISAATVHGLSDQRCYWFR